MRLITIVSALLASALVAHAAPAQPLEERKHSHKHARHHASRVTYYGGGQLKNPACGGPNPHPNDMIAAVKKGGHFKCHDHIHIRKGSKKVTVRVVDYCAGCDDGAVDLSKGAFKKLASLDEGVVSDASMWVQ